MNTPTEWFEIDDATGNVVGISTMSQAEALKNLPSGCTLMPREPDIDHRQKRWDKQKNKWVKKTQKPIDLADDYVFMRGSGYNVPAQVGAMMKVIGALLDNSDIRALLPADIIAEFEDAQFDVARIKRENPKTSG
jgi:hypothetical protein